MGNAQGKGEQLSGIDATIALEQNHVPSAPTIMGRVPLAFHEVHGENVRLFSNGRVAKRVESFCKGLAFSNRPIAVDEIVCVKFSEISKNWSGVLRFGLSNNDPATLANDLPRFACPNLTNKEGNWAKALPEKYCQQGAILHFYVRENGEMYYGINGVQKGQFLVGINTASPLYVILDIYGNSTAVQFMDPGEVPPLRSHRGGNSSGAGPSTSTSSVSAQTNRLAAELSARTTLPQNSRCHAGVAFRPLTFHPVCGTNITLASQGTIASRLETEYTQGYVFTKRPIKVREKLVLQILTTLPAYEGGLALGVTACNPNDLLPNQLPSDSDLLLDRLEYWVVAKDVASKPRQGDELAFYIGNSGEMYYYKNNGPPRVIMHVDQTQALWMFFDLYGNTQRVQLLGTTDVDSRGPETSESRGSRRTSANTSSPSNHPVSEAEQNLINFGPDVPSTPSTSSSTLSTAGLRVNLPPPPEGATPRRPPPPVSTASYTRPPINSRWGNRVPPTPPPRPKPPVKGDAGAGTAAGGGEGAGKVAALGEECTVCMVSPVDCVLYTCGHMCMCFECAQEPLKVRKKSGECPMCRQMIYDVIKTFKA